MDKLNFSYKKFNLSQIEAFTNNQALVISQQREVDKVDIYSFNIINPGHTFRELNIILNKYYNSRKSI